MGGLWSGQRASKKAVVEGRPALDTSDLHRMGLLTTGTVERAGSLHWRRDGEDEPYSSVGYTLALAGGSGTLELHYQTGEPKEQLKYAVPLVITPCHLGGVRWWFLCPLSMDGTACERRVRRLYLRGRYFGCRHCHALTYTSTQQSDGRVYALLRDGLDPGWFNTPGRMSVPQLGLALKALTLERQRLERFDHRRARKRWLDGQRGRLDKRT